MLYITPYLSAKHVYILWNAVFLEILTFNETGSTFKSRNNAGALCLTFYKQMSCFALFSANWNVFCLPFPKVRLVRLQHYEMQQIAEEQTKQRSSLYDDGNEYCSPPKPNQQLFNSCRISALLCRNVFLPRVCTYGL